MKKAILSNWSVIRALRLIIGVGILYEGIITNDVLFGLAGLLFTGMAIFNRGCCGSQACYSPPKKISAAGKDITYDEIV
jgi:hypothetical protein